MLARNDFWIDGDGKALISRGHHCGIVRKKILEDAGITMDGGRPPSGFGDAMLESHGVPPGSDEYEALFGDFEDAYSVAIVKWGWVRVVGDRHGDGDNPYCYVRDFDGVTMKRIASAFESVYGESAYAFRYYVEKYDENLEGDAGTVDFWTLDRGGSPRLSSTWLDRGMRREAALGTGTVEAGLDYYVGEYADMLQGTVYERWMLDGDVIPMSWNRVSSNVIDVFVTVYMGLRHDSAEFLRELRDGVIRPAGWSVEMTTPGNWVEKDGERYSVIRMELEKN